MIYTDKDKRFIQEMKARGYSAEETYSKLMMVKEKSGQTQASQPKKEKGLLRKGADFLATAGATAISEVGKGLGNIAKATDYINPVSWAQKIAGQETLGEGLQKGFNKMAEAPIKGMEQSGIESNAGEITGKVLGTVAKQVPAYAIGGAALSGIKEAPKLAGVSVEIAPKAQKIGTFIKQNVDKYPSLAKAANFITKSAGSTAIVTQTERGELPTAKEIGTYGALDLALFGVSKLGGSIFRSAFGGPKSQEVNYLKEYKKTIGQTAEDLGYWGTAKQINKKASTKLTSIWDDIVKTAKEGGDVSNEQFMGIKTKLLEPYNKLPDSQYKDEIIKAISDTVDAYAPKVSAKGDEVIQTISEINANLFNNGQKISLTPKQVSSIENSMKSEIKNLLPPEIKGLYKDYAVNRLIKEVMNNEEIKRLVGRSLIGGGTLATVGGVSSGVATGGDIGQIFKYTVMGAITGALLTSATGSTLLKTGGGKALKKAQEPVVSALLKATIEKLQNES